MINILQDPYIIAEIGINHNGDIKEAFELIELAALAGVNAVKFQKRNLKHIYTKKILDNPNSEEWSFQYLVPQLKALEFTEDQYYLLLEKSRECKLDFIVTPFDFDSLKFAVKLGVDAIKIASADLVYWPLIEKAVEAKLPIILSTGMWDHLTIKKTIDFIKNLTNNFAVLHCQSTYPAPEDNLNIKYINVLKKMWPKVGYSSHDRGILGCILAYSQGATIIEKHITKCSMQLGPDHKASVEPAELKLLVENIKKSKIILGTEEKIVNQAETLNKEVFAKSAYLIKSLKKGSLVTKDDVEYLSPGKGIFACDMVNYLEKPLYIDKKAGELLIQEDFSENIRIRDWPSFNFTRQWGVKCRFHDFDDYNQVESKCVEFHCSDKDLGLNFKEGNPKKELIIHAPEIMDRELFDLCSKESRVIQKSIDILNATIQMTKKIHTQFKQGQNPKIVLHVGGMKLNNEVVSVTDMTKEAEKYLKEIDMSGVDLLPENLPPRPWYLGGQWYQHAFCEPNQMAEFCKNLGLGMTLDICHAQLYCKYAGIDLINFVKIVLPYTKHVHISDAVGIDGEGVQIGEGVINFDQLFKVLEKQKFTWVPEIWSGHCRHGLGNYNALQKLDIYNAL